MYSRRDFGKFAVAGLPLSMSMGVAAGAKINSVVSGVHLGNSTYSYRDIPHAAGGDSVDAVIAALITDGAGEIELFAPTIEPAGPPRPAGPPAGGPRAGTPPGAAPGARMDPEARAAAMRARANSPEVLKAREDLRQWRITTPMSHFHGVAKKFTDAGVKIDAYTMNYRNDFTDEEIDKTFEQAKALGTNVIATSTQMDMAKRLVPFAEKHKIIVALHGHSNTRDPQEFSSPETFQKGMEMSKYFKINLDIGHFSAAGFDPIAYINEHHASITHLHMKDRKNNDGANTPWGEGDTPIKQVLILLRDKKYPIPAIVEYEYRGTGTSTEEVKKCMDYMRNALA